MNKERKGSVQPAGNNPQSSSTNNVKQRSASITHHSNSYMVKNLDSRREGSQPAHKKSQSKQGRSDSMQLGIPNEKQMFQSITHHSNPLGDEGVFNASFNGAASSHSNYHKRKQQVQSITQLLNSTDGLKKYTLKTGNLNLNRDDQLTNGINLQTNNLFMPTSSTKGQSAAAGKNTAIMASDLGISMKSMYKQLASGGGPVENKNYLNSHVQPAAQLQASKVMNAGNNLN